MCAEAPTAPGAAPIRKGLAPCICPRQNDQLNANGKPVRGSRACGFTVSRTRYRGVLHERVACADCPRTWTRIHG